MTDLMSDSALPGLSVSPAARRASPVSQAVRKASSSSVARTTWGSSESASPTRLE